ncbi:survival of motor neuron-related-splicing factor 30-like isoform X2 [Iris pallida]|uniref:Survival of motor neuron-related-splicing factor 30-like isoform X2 n=1 Tax=Iris pallida TaxID=29817 RepID=A0AAX6G3E3_IRIPA|nr:survival of motor neuron-related-splicing factor 30-like isoform X2 [Iris pallida]KAJ6829553.1 survival of motor neuron-related-splicing factor 30-like isoform X2 [Iris pallida]
MPLKKNIALCHRKLQNARRFILSNQRIGLRNLRLCKTSVKMLGSSSKQQKKKQRRCACT